MPTFLHKDYLSSLDDSFIKASKNIVKNYDRGYNSDYVLAKKELSAHQQMEASKFMGSLSNVSVYLDEIIAYSLGEQYEKLEGGWIDSAGVKREVTTRMFKDSLERLLEQKGLTVELFKSLIARYYPSVSFEDYIKLSLDHINYVTAEMDLDKTVDYVDNMIASDIDDVYVRYHKDQLDAQEHFEEPLESDEESEISELSEPEEPVVEPVHHVNKELIIKQLMKELKKLRKPQLIALAERLHIPTTNAIGKQILSNDLMDRIAEKQFSQLSHEEIESLLPKNKEVEQLASSIKITSNEDTPEAGYPEKVAMREIPEHIEPIRKPSNTYNQILSTISKARIELNRCGKYFKGAFMQHIAKMKTEDANEITELLFKIKTQIQELLLIMDKNIFDKPTEKLMDKLIESVKELCDSIQAGLDSLKFKMSAETRSEPVQDDDDDSLGDITWGSPDTRSLDLSYRDLFDDSMSGGAMRPKFKFYFDEYKNMPMKYFL
jgi:hypothetical protein